ncbi:hypothetical protein [Mesorhizobium sp. B2-3-5]|uniref:hypothetical protein n=1 Tax=Mesorhizobium sp. B2-3-5 TaxID=2589958 RepID=UPI00112E6D24|nr:hypothetical protein [Mesorhizobium sp. B2-3-5]TPM24384.1 hypothetical protein FJ958_23265 [Mesorhizobium sp. B2-3-5]
MLLLARYQTVAISIAALDWWQQAVVPPIAMSLSARTNAELPVSDLCHFSAPVPTSFCKMEHEPAWQDAAGLALFPAFR